MSRREWAGEAWRGRATILRPAVEEKSGDGGRDASSLSRSVGSPFRPEAVRAPFGPRRDVAVSRWEGHAARPRFGPRPRRQFKPNGESRPGASRGV